jgi:hypothetical protein
MPRRQVITETATIRMDSLTAPTPGTEPSQHS